MSKKTKSPKKKSTVRHTRAIQRDRSKRPIVAPPPEQVSDRLREVILPATQAEQDKAHATFGVRVRKLTLVVMMAFVLSLIWRQVGSISEGVRLLNTEGLLWAAVVTVSQQAMSQRLGSLPAELFLRVLVAVLPLFHARWKERQRPLPPELAWAQAHYSHVLACDGSTLDALLRKVGLLREASVNPLAGRMTALLDLCSRLPQQVWYEPDPDAHDQRFPGQDRLATDSQRPPGGDTAHFRPGLHQLQGLCPTDGSPDRLYHPRQVQFVVPGGALLASLR